MARHLVTVSESSDSITHPTRPMKAPSTTVTFHHWVFAALLKDAPTPLSVTSSRVFFASLPIRPAGYLDGSWRNWTPVVLVYFPMIIGSGIVAAPVDVGF